MKTRKNYKYKTVRGLLADKSRWCKGAHSKVAEDGTKSYCILGAIDCIYTRKSRYWDTRTNVANAILKLFPRASRFRSHGDIIMDFNDAKRRTHEQVLQVLKEAKV